MKNFIRKHRTAAAILVVVLCLNLSAALTNTFNTASPAGSDDPRQADDRMREIKAAVQERMNDHNGEADEGDHFWPLDGSLTTQVLHVDTGQHRMVTLRQMSGNPSALTSYASIANLGFLFQKDVSGNGELFWQDEAASVLQITTGGDLCSSSGEIVGTADTVIRRGTADASDNGYVAMAGGGGSGTDRGSIVASYGNEHTTYPGQILLSPGYSTGTTPAIINATTHKISNVVDPEAAQDAATKKYVDDFKPGFCKAWALIDANGNITAGFGVASVSVHGTGSAGDPVYYTITWTTPFSSNNYCVNATAFWGGNIIPSPAFDSMVGASINVRMFNNDSTATSAKTAFCIMAFGTQ
jgi:hypothetical protein